MALLAVGVIIASCGPNEQSPPATSNPFESTTTTLAQATTTTTDAIATTTTRAHVTTTTVRGIDVEIAGGEVMGPATFEVALREPVDIWILSDVDDEIHVHGYDLRFDLVAGEPLNLSFEADVPGIFEVETHGRRGPLFEIEVTG